jgi:hypothetical protein
MDGCSRPQSISSATEPDQDKVAIHLTAGLRRTRIAVGASKPLTTGIARPLHTLVLRAIPVPRPGPCLYPRCIRCVGCSGSAAAPSSVAGVLMIARKDMSEPE